MLLEICSYCYNYQRRWAWQLSSILQQRNRPDFVISIAYVMGNGNPSMEKIFDFYEGLHGFKFKKLQYKSIDEMSQRGAIRNRQIKEATGDVLYFSDPDHIYPTKHLDDIRKYVEEHRNIKKIFTTKNKITTDAVETQDVITTCNDVLVRDAYFSALKIKRYCAHIRNTAGGCCFIADINTIKEKTGGTYSFDSRENDRHIFDQRTWSDRDFKSMMGGTCDMHLEPLIHLNHLRWNAPDYNTEQQR